MSYMPVTPFRRAMSGALLEQIQQAERAPLPEVVNKWDILRDLTVARKEVGVTDRELRVLQALLSFHPETELTGAGENLVVFPSNAAICERLNGMACSTMRRHLGKLIEAGLLVRRDSPNGKRFARRDRAGVQAFGFDLSPLLARAEGISAMATAARDAEAAYKRHRQTVSLMRRDLASLVEYAKQHAATCSSWDQLDDLARLTARSLRRQLTIAELSDLELEMGEAIAKAKGKLGWKTPEVSTKDAQNEQHHQSSNKDYKKNRPSEGPEKKRSPGSPIDTSSVTNPKPDDNIPLPVVLSAFPEALTYAGDPIESWQHFNSLAVKIRPMMGIKLPAWETAVGKMGLINATLVLFAILEKFSKIRSPAAYLLCLADKFSNGTFSCLPMVLALVSRNDATSSQL